MAKSAKDLQRLTGLGINQVYAGITCGQLPGYYVGRRVVIPDEAFDRFRRGEWTSNPRPYFDKDPVPLPEPEDFIQHREERKAS